MAAAVGRNESLPTVQGAFAHARAGRLREADAACAQLLAVEPQNAAALSLAGEIALRLGDPGRALAQTQRAVELSPDDATLRCALGDVYRAHNRANDAMAQFHRAWELDPSHPSASNRLISLLMQAGLIEEGVEHFCAALARDPRLRAAYGYLLPAIARWRGRSELDGSTPPPPIEPLWTIACHALRHAVNSSARLTDPLRADGRSANTDTGCASIFMTLYNALLARQRPADALACIRALEAIEPESASAKHLAAALSGEPLERASAEYCAGLFDAFAAEFDQHLTRELAYVVPHRLAELAREVAQPPSGGWDVIDLGCGTGLAGLALRGHARSLVGVDLSSGMLGYARMRGIYSRLEKADLLDFLQHEPKDSCDLVVAADVFCYLGALDAVFGRMRRPLRRGGLVVFSVEALESAVLGAASERHACHSLTISGRFAHSREYLEQLAAQHGFAVVSATQAVLRTDRDGQIRGWLYALRKD